MKTRRQSVLDLIHQGKNNFEIAFELKITQANVWTVRSQLKRMGFNLITPKQGVPLPLSIKQRTVLYFYSINMQIPEIASKMQITCQTVMNHASEGFKRLGLVKPGQDRIKEIQKYFESAKEIPIKVWMMNELRSREQPSQNVEDY